MVDLSTTFLGLQLENPLVAAASPLSERVETACKLEEAGVSAIVVYSLFEEQIILESLKLNNDLSRGAYSSAETLTYLPDFGQYSIGPDAYVEHVRKIKNAVNIPVVGSLNGATTGGWIEYAKKIEQAGADALELNVYNLPAKPDLTSADVEDIQATLVYDICRQVSIPVAVKLSPFYTALPNFAQRLIEAGAKGLVLFNRFYQPDFDLEELEVNPNLVLSTSQELRLPLRWIAILYGRVQADFALTSGVHTAEDLIKAMMAGASIVEIASELLQNGIRRVPWILAQMYDWMEAHEYLSVRQMKGSMSQHSVAEPASFERANYMAMLSSY